ncbi:hypothetical protein DL93DRAFT_1295369 [Clavulina sp. PMI_390]|nr:hypothetical protein DL93DRAFT_1295369 [Clavulina sp. PMI_390]
MSVQEARALVTYPYRLERLLLEFAPHSVSGLETIEMSPLSIENTHSLRTPDGSSVIEWCGLPGNRWVCAVVSLRDSIMQLCVWDINSPSKMEGIPPVSSISSDNTFHALAWPCELWPQFDEARNVVNFLLCFLTDSEYILEVYQLIWTNGSPVFTGKASRRRPRTIWISQSAHKAWLDGDYACLRCDDGILLWNWQEDTSGFVPTDSATVSPPLYHDKKN